MSFLQRPWRNCRFEIPMYLLPWWRHQMETFSALLAICAGNSPVSGELPAQRTVTRSFDVFFDVRLIKRLSEHSRGWWFETLSHPLWRHSNAVLVALFLCLVSVFNWWQFDIVKDGKYKYLVQNHWKWPPNSVMFIFISKPKLWYH